MVTSDVKQSALPGSLRKFTSSIKRCQACCKCIRITRRNADSSLANAVTVYLILVNDLTQKVYDSPTAVATTGRALAMASIRVSGVPSLNEVKLTMSRAG